MEYTTLDTYFSNASHIQLLWDKKKENVIQLLSKAAVLLMLFFIVFHCKIRPKQTETLLVIVKD